MPLFNPPYIPDLYAPGQSAGDTVYFDGTNWTRLPIGSSGSYLYTSGSTIPRWTSDLSGSLQRLTSGQTYLAAGANVTITTQSNGQVVISTSATGSSGSPANTTPYSDQLGEVFLATVTQSVYRKSLPVVTANGWLVNNFGMMLVTTSSIDPNYLTAGTVYATGTGADVSASYIVVSLTSSLPNERALSAGTGVKITDSGAGGNVVFSINDGIVATLSGSTFSGVVNAPKLSGSLQKLTTGESYLVAGSGLQVTSSSLGQVVVGINNSVVATVSGTTFTGPVSASAGLSGSLQQIAAGLSYLVAGTGITIISSSLGQIFITSTALPSYTTVTVDLGVGRSNGTFDITGLSGLTTDKVVSIMQTAGAISSKGSAHDEPEMDLIVLTGYVLNATTIRAYWNAPNIVVGTYEFAYLVSA